MFVLNRALAALALVILLPVAAEASARDPKVNQRARAHYSVSQLYSSRARRRAVRILQLKLLELHEENLDRLRQVILRKLPIDTLLKAAKPPE